MREFYAIGLMSGSSLDGLDIAYCRLQIDDKTGAVGEWAVLQAETQPFSEQWQLRLSALAEQSALVLAKTDVYFAYYMADLVRDFVKRRGIGRVDFVASHGHTVFHEPARQFTLQIGSAAALSARLGYCVVGDFRSQDVAQGGEGAPLAPLVDRLIFTQADFSLNLGGIANLSARLADKTIGFDVCYSNQVLNFFAQKIAMPYDKGGRIAAVGRVQADLLEQLRALDFFRKKYPKSLGNDFVPTQVLPIFAQREPLPIADALATACEHIALEVAKAMQKVAQHERWQRERYRVLVSGGGALNDYLMERLRAHCEAALPCEWLEVSGETIQYKEALLMALLGALRLMELPNVPIEATGGKLPLSAGGVYLPPKAV